MCCVGVVDVCASSSIYFFVYIAYPIFPPCPGAVSHLPPIPHSYINNNHHQRHQTSSHNNNTNLIQLVLHTLASFPLQTPTSSFLLLIIIAPYINHVDGVSISQSIALFSRPHFPSLFTFPSPHSSTDLALVPPIPTTPQNVCFPPPPPAKSCTAAYTLLAPWARQTVADKRKPADLA